MKEVGSLRYGTIFKKAFSDPEISSSNGFCGLGTMVARHDPLTPPSPPLPLGEGGT